MIGDGVNVLISHAAATSFIHIVVFAVIQTSHNMRKTGNDSGAHALVEATGRSGASGGEIGKERTPGTRCGGCRRSRRGLSLRRCGTAARHPGCCRPLFYLEGLK